LKALDDLGIANDTIVVYTTDNGPHMNSWPDAAMTPFRSEKDTNWEGAFRVPAMVRWPGRIKPGSISNEIFSGHDWFATLLAVAGDTDVKDRLVNGWQVGDRTYKVHIDGYNQLPHLTGQQDKSERKGFIYLDDDGHVVAVRYGNWKMVFAEQNTPGTLDIWGEPPLRHSSRRLKNSRQRSGHKASASTRSWRNCSSRRTTDSRSRARGEG
jgi:arylsulfatase